MYGVGGEVDLQRRQLGQDGRPVGDEVFEHVDNPGGFLQGVESLLAPGGTAIVTTPNASGWFNSVAALANFEVNHPDHIVMFSWRTLSNLMRRNGLEVVDAATFVPEVKDGAAEAVGDSPKSKAMGWAMAMGWGSARVWADPTPGPGGSGCRGRRRYRSRRSQR